MKGYFEINYCVYVKYDENKFYHFIKKSIIYNETNYQPCHEPIKNEKVYNIFFMLYPILKTIPRKNIEIRKAWESWHPDDKIPTNVYNKEEDDYITQIYKNWAIKNKIIL